MSTPSYAEWLRRQMEIDDLAMQAHRNGREAVVEHLYRENALRTFRRWDSGVCRIIVIGESCILVNLAVHDGRLRIHNLSPDVLHTKDPTNGYFDAEVRQRAAIALEAFLAWRDRGAELPEHAPWEKP